MANNTQLKIETWRRNIYSSLLYYWNFNFINNSWCLYSRVSAAVYNDRYDDYAVLVGSQKVSLMIVENCCCYINLSLSLKRVLVFYIASLNYLVYLFFSNITYLFGVFEKERWKAVLKLAFFATYVVVKALLTRKNNAILNALNELRCTY